MLWVDALHRLIDGEELFRGTLTQTSVYPREVAKGALARSACSVALYHNHPSGHPEPSQADERLTQTLKTESRIHLYTLGHTTAPCSDFELNRRLAEIREVGAVHHLGADSILSIRARMGDGIFPSEVARRAMFSRGKIGGKWRARGGRLSGNGSCTNRPIRAAPTKRPQCNPPTLSMAGAVWDLLVLPCEPLPPKRLPDPGETVQTRSG